MLDQRIDLGITAAEQVVMQIGLPAWIVRIDGAQMARYYMLNPAAEAATGLRSADLAGRTPHDVLPPRVADTLLCNYCHCIRNRQPYKYDELLELPTGPMWWRTTLSPIFDAAGRVAVIIGTSEGISDLKMAKGALSDTADVWRNRAAQVSAAAHANLLQLRGPLNLISVLAKLGISPDQKRQSPDGTLEMILKLGLEALEELETAAAQADQGSDNLVRELVNLDHLCRDFAAEVDPSCDLVINFSSAQFWADRETLQLVLRNVFHWLVGLAGTDLQISAGPNPGDPDQVAIVFAFRGRAMGMADTGQTYRAADQLRSLAEACQGTMTVLQNEGEEELVVRLSFPGQMVPSDRSSGAVKPRLPSSQVAQGGAAEPARPTLPQGWLEAALSRQRLTIG